MEATRIYAVDLLRPMKVGEVKEIEKALIDSQQMSQSARYLKLKKEGTWKVTTRGRKNHSTYFVERLTKLV